MNKSFSGNIALVCPDCENHLINLAPNEERYHCADCGLRLVREQDSFHMLRDGEAVGLVPVEAVQIKVTWRALASAAV